MVDYKFDAKEISIDQLPSESCQTVAHAIGIENMLKLSDIIGGVTFYLPKRKDILKFIRNKRIKEEFNGGNTVELSKKYGISERWVQIILKENR